VAALQAAYAVILERTGWDGVVIHSGTPKSRSVFDDQYWPLRPTPHFQHWLPLVREDCALLLRPGQVPTLFLNGQQSYWESWATPETDHFYAAFQVVEVEKPDKLKELLPAAGRLAFVGEDGYRASRWGFAYEDQNPVALLAELDGLRVAKTSYERLCLTEANRRAAEGHARVRAAFLAGDHSELELHLLFLQATGQDDPETPYKNIVAMGHNAAVLHHVRYDRRRSGGSPASLLVDAGATYQGYASDITRTVVKGTGEGAEVFAALIERLERLQEDMCAHVRLGVAYESLHDRSHELLAPIVRELGIVDASDEELVSSSATRLLFPHGLGHSLGLQVHDVGCARERPRPENPFLRNTSLVQAGQAFTIEPGCYFIDEKLEALYAGPLGARVDRRLVSALARFGGVRIEDDLAVTDAGVRNLTREHLP
jgi:Xaa-Pro dipeptidase